MPIPESQLDTWAGQGAIQGSKETYAIVKRVLESSDTPFARKDFSTFLQGSYCNDTNIYAESDVDIVIRLDSIYYYDVDKLSTLEKSVFDSAFIPATYHYAEFKTHVTSTLARAFGSDVKPGNKAVAIEAAGGRRKADVLVSTEFRRYYTGRNFVQGVCFFTSWGEQLVNYPKQHSANVTAKHQATGGWFKPTVRIFKNARRKMVADEILPIGIAPSYFLEGLLYNVPNDKFGRSYQDTIVSSLNWILATDRTDFVCANEQYYLLRNGEPNCWPITSCDRFLEAFVKLWEDW